MYRMFPDDTGIKAGLFMIALAVGYVIRSLAEKQEKELKVLGKVISLFIILTSSAFLLLAIITRIAR